MDERYTRKSKSNPRENQIQFITTETSTRWAERLSNLRPGVSAGDSDPLSRSNLPTLVYDQGSLVGLLKQDYKSLCAAVTICATLVNIQVHTQTDRQTAFDQLSKAQPAELIKPRSNLIHVTFNSLKCSGIR